MASTGVSAKRQKLNNAEETIADTKIKYHGLGPSDLAEWASDYRDENINSNSIRESLLESRNINAFVIFNFTLDRVLCWKRDEIMMLGSQVDTDKLINGGNRCLRFVTDWLARDAPGENSSEIPSLARLCAQRIAMDKISSSFDKLEMYDCFKTTDELVDSFEDHFQSKLADDGLPEFLKTLVLEELYVFATVYFLYIDFRELADEPRWKRDIKLPIEYWGGSSNNWWKKKGQNEMFNAVRNKVT